MFRTVRVSIIRNLFTVHSAMVCVIQELLVVPSWSCSKTVYKPVLHIPLLSLQRINSWWWTDELSETCRVSWQNKFVKSVHLVGFITNKFVMIYLDLYIQPGIVVGFSLESEVLCCGQCTIRNSISVLWNNLTLLTTLYSCNKCYPKDGRNM
jgi:hypothetical protein